MVGNKNLYPLVSGYTSQWCKCKRGVATLLEVYIYTYIP